MKTILLILICFSATTLLFADDKVTGNEKACFATMKSIEVMQKMYHRDEGKYASDMKTLLATIKMPNDALLKAFVKENKPSYIECEKWVLKNGTPCPCEIAKLNRQITQYHHDDDTRKGILEAAGLDDSAAIADAPNLNNLDDWTGFHKEVILGA